MSTQELIKEVESLPEPLQREVYDFVLREKSENGFNGLLLSESALGRDWNTPEEDAVHSRRHDSTLAQ